MGTDKNGKTLPKGITQRKDGLYMWRFKYSGETYTGYSKKLTDAQTDMRNKRYEVEHGMSSKEKAVSLDAWFSEWLDTYKTGLKTSTLAKYRSFYNEYIKEPLGRKQLKNLRPDTLQRFVNDLAENFSKSIVSNVHFLLYDCLRQAVRNEIIFRNPMDLITPPKCKTPEKKGALSAEEEQLFLDAAETSHYYPLYRLATLTGMRIGEVLGLQWKDIDFHRGEIHITHTLNYTVDRGQYLDDPKSEAGRRVIPMEPDSELYKLLKAQKAEQKLQKLRIGDYWQPLEGLDDLVFTTRHGTPHSPVNVNTEMRKIVADLKTKGTDIQCTFHTLRHTFATRCIENGMAPKTLQAILGHSTIAMTMDRYCDVMEDTKRSELQKVMVAL